MARALLSIDDFGPDDVRWVLGRAEELSQGSRSNGSVAVAGLLFLEASLRTRVGFAAAAARCGIRAVEVFERRSSPTSIPESLRDTIETIADYVDLLVIRPGDHVERSFVERLECRAVLSGGGFGPDAEHPSQALIDMRAIEKFVPDMGAVRIAIWGDLRMRSVRSLVRLLDRSLPARLLLVSHPDLRDEAPLPKNIAGITTWATPDEAANVDVVYVAGMPHDCLPLPEREGLIVGEHVMARLPSHAVVLSPMPVIDEIDPAVRRDPRVKVFQQNREALFVRMALLELMSASPG